MYKRFEAETGNPVAAANLTLAHAMLQKQRQEQEQTLTAAEAAKRLKVSVKKVYRLCKEGVIPHHRVGDAIRIKPGDLDMLSRQSEETAPARRRTKWL